MSSPTSWTTTICMHSGGGGGRDGMAWPAPVNGTVARSGSWSWPQAGQVKRVGAEARSGRGVTSANRRGPVTSSDEGVGAVITLSPTGGTDGHRRSWGMAVEGLIAACGFRRGPWAGRGSWPRQQVETAR